MRTARFYVRNTQSSASVGGRATRAISIGALRGAAAVWRGLGRRSQRIAARTTIKTVTQASIAAPDNGPDDPTADDTTADDTTADDTTADDTPADDTPAENGAPENLEICVPTPHGSMPARTAAAQPAPDAGR